MKFIKSGYILKVMKQLLEELIKKSLDELYEAAYNETDDMKAKVEQLVPTYKKDNK